MPEAPENQFNWSAPSIQVGIASGQSHTSIDSFKLDLPGLPNYLPIPGHAMPGFHHNILGIGDFFDADCKVIFTKTSVTIFDKNGYPVITGWIDNNSPKLWNIPLLPNEDDSHVRNQAEQTTIGVYSAYNIHSISYFVW